jgi:hypothetical protein
MQLFIIISPLIPNALLSRTYCRAIFVHKMERSEMHKNAAQYVSDAAIC